MIYSSRRHPHLEPTGDPYTADGFWFRDLVDSFRASTYDDAASPSTSDDYATVEYQTVLIDVPIYLQYLLRRITSLGGHTIRATLLSEDGLGQALNTAASLVEKQFPWLPEQEHDNPIFINAVGLGARELCRDGAMHPIRGQVLIVKGVAHAARSRLGTDNVTGEPFVAYAIPRPLSGVTILGGCQERGNWSDKEDVATTEKILERCQTLAPELLTGDRHENQGFEVQGCQVGLRPGREGGARVEAEVIVVDEQHKRYVVHAYGHAGAGYQNSIGVASTVVELVSLRPGNHKETKN